MALSAVGSTNTLPVQRMEIKYRAEICRRIDTTGYAAERKAGSGRPKSVRTAPNIDRVEELICSQEGATETHRSTRWIVAELNISERSVRRIAREDLHVTCFRRVPAQIITDAVRSVSVNAKTDVFTSEKYVKNVQNFLAG